MKIDIVSLQRSFASNVSSSQKTNQDFDLRLNSQLMEPTTDEIVQPTSVSLCTPTCGKTGTGNSFCCTCPN